MKVVIDTNIYLNFYRKRDDQSLLFIKPLIELVENNKFQLILPVQIKNEFSYWKDAIVKEQIKCLEDGLKVTMQLPDFINKSREVKKLNTAIKSLRTLKNKAIDEYRKRSFNPSSNINIGINKLFNVAIKVDGADVVQRAYFRTLQGYPPRKGNGSFGDAIIWETLLELCPDDDLTIVSADGDYASSEKPKKIHGFLEKEWADKTDGKSVKLYDNLGKFINDNSPEKKKPISKELIEKDEQKLSGGIFDFVTKFADGAFALTSFGEQIATTLGITTQVCNCCGKSFQSNPYSLTTIAGSGNKCADCAGCFLGEGKTCSRCGKHYHEELVTFSLTAFRNLCSDCESNRSISFN